MSTLISRLYTYVTDKANALFITASKMDAENDQIITALNRKGLCSASAPGSPIAGQTWIDTTNKVLKIYLNNEWVIHGPVHIGTSAPATPFEGMVWWETDTDLLKAYSGSAWLNIPAIASCAAGDVMYHDGTSWVRLAKGTAGQKLKINAGATAPEWVGAEFGARVDVSAAGDHDNELAATDGIVEASNGNGDTVIGYSDTNSPPTTVRQRNKGPAGESASISMPVRKGERWKTTGDTTTFWMPVGAA